MQIEFITNATVIVTMRAGTTVLVDPWMSDGIFYGTYFPYPPITDEQKDRYHAVRPDYIYISHIHPDHFDRETLKHYDRSIPILIGKLPHDHLKRAIAAVGFTDIRELELDRELPFEGGRLAILDEHGEKLDGSVDEVGYTVDTSLILRDTDGTLLFHAVDNPTNAEHGRQIRAQYGQPDVAILAYSGASFFPHAFPQYTDAEKAERRDHVRALRVQGFLDLVRVLEPKIVIPANGSHVIGGPIATYSRWLHQATPAQVDAAWQAGGMPAQIQLTQMCTGDILEVDTGAVSRDETALHRNFDADLRADFALSLADHKADHEGIVIPEAFSVPWRRLASKARANQWRMQERKDLKPAADIEVVLTEGNAVSLGADGARLHIRIALDSPDMPAFANADEGPLGPRDGRSYIRFTLDAGLMLMALNGAANWNNIELSALVTCEREPDNYDPTLHSLMAFFQL